MSRLAANITKLTKQKVARGTIVDVMGDLCSVRLSTRGPILRALRYTGPTPVKGDVVVVDYRSGTPVVLTNSKNLQKAIDELRVELTAAQQAISSSTNSKPPEDIDLSNLEFLADIGDVDVSDVMDGYVLTYNEATETWIAAEPVSGGGGGGDSGLRAYVVMASGVSNPPVPVVTPDGTNWVYFEA